MDKLFKEVERKNMKNKRLIGVVIFLFLLTIGDIFSIHMSKKDQINSQLKTSQTAKVAVLQYVTHPSLDLIYQGIKEGLAQEGYQGEKLKIDFMNAEGDQNKLATMSKQLVANGNDLFIGIATPSAQGLANATKERPIIMGAVSDPIGAKLVKDLKRPSGNITGVSDQNPTQQQLDLIKKITPNVNTIGVLYSSNEDNSKVQVEDFTRLAEQAGYQVRTYAVPSTNEIAQTIGVMTNRVDAIWIPNDNTIASAFATVVSSNQQAKKPIFPSAAAMVEEGGLATVAVDQFELGLATGKMAAKILNGANPADTEVELFNTGKAVLNQAVAEELGISFSAEVLEEAGEVIQK